MASLNSAAQKLKKEKSLLSKIKRSSEREFNKVQAISGKYSSSLTSVQKRVDSYREQVENIGQILNQKIIQLESVQRLKNTAAEKLGLEKQNTEQLEDESKYVSTKEEKQSIESKLNVIHGVIDNIQNELKQRKSMEKKLLQAIDEYTKSKLRVSTKIKKDLTYRSKLEKLVKISQSNVDSVSRKFNLTKSRKDSANKRSRKITSQLYEILRKRGKAKPKVKRGNDKPKVKRGKAKPKVKRGNDKPKVKRGNDKPKVKRGNDKPKVKRGNDKPKVKRGNDKPKVKRGNDKPKVKRGNDKPKVKRGNDKPKVKRGNDKPKVKRGKAKPKVKRGKAKPKVKKKTRR